MFHTQTQQSMAANGEVNHNKNNNTSNINKKHWNYGEGDEYDKRPAGITFKNQAVQTDFVDDSALKIQAKLVDGINKINPNKEFQTKTQATNTFNYCDNNNNNNEQRNHNYKQQTSDEAFNDVALVEEEAYYEGEILWNNDANDVNASEEHVDYIDVDESRKTANGAAITADECSIYADEDYDGDDEYSNHLLYNERNDDELELENDDDDEVVGYELDEGDDYYEDDDDEYIDNGDHVSAIQRWYDLETEKTTADESDDSAVENVSDNFDDIDEHEFYEENVEENISDDEDYVADFVDDEEADAAEMNIADDNYVDAEENDAAAENVVDDEENVNVDNETDAPYETEEEEVDAVDDDIEEDNEHENDGDNDDEDAVDDVEDEVEDDGSYNDVEDIEDYADHDDDDGYVDFVENNAVADNKLQATNNKIASDMERSDGFDDLDSHYYINDYFNESDFELNDDGCAVFKVASVYDKIEYRNGMTIEEMGRLMEQQQQQQQRQQQLLLQAALSTKHRRNANA